MKESTGSREGTPKEILSNCCCTIEFDTTISVDENDDAYYDFWEFCPDTYDCFRAYYDYDLYASEEHVMVYKKGGVGDSDREEEEGEEV